MFKKLLVCLLITAMILPALVSCNVNLQDLGDKFGDKFGASDADENASEYTGENDLDFYPLPDGTYGVMAGKTKFLETIVIPATHNGRAVTQILPEAFAGAKNLKSITIPDSVTIIDDRAFMECYDLTSVTIAEGSKLTIIGNAAFTNCTNLTNITIPDGVTTIEECTFENCYNLTSVTLGSGITSIGISAFNGCSSLVDIYYNGTADDWYNISLAGDFDTSKYIIHLMKS